MTVLERCTFVRSQIDALNAIKKAYKNAATFRERSAELKTLREDFDEAVSRLEVLRARDLLPRNTPSPTKALTIVARCHEGLEANPNEIGADYGNLKRALGGLTKKGIIGTVDAVIDAVQRDLPALDEAFLKQVESVPGYEIRVARIREQRQALRGADPKQSAEALGHFLDRRKELRALADDLNPSEFPADVLEFFRVSRQERGAPLEKFTNSVHEWLKERGLLKNVRVTVSAK